MSKTSKNKVIVHSVTIQKLTIKEVATKYGVSERWVYQLLKKHRHYGEAGLAPQPKRPKTNPNQTNQETIAKIVELRQQLIQAGLDAGAHTIAWHLKEQNFAPPASSTIWRILKQQGLVTPQPKKKPKAYLQRFEALQPNETWQSDFTHWRLADGSDVEILNWLDDHSRMLLSCKVFRPVYGTDVVETFKECVNEYGPPYSTLTDNGTVYTARFVKGRNQFEYLLRTLGVKQKNGSPGHPQTQGKIERFHQTQKRWLSQQPKCENMAELQLQLNEFTEIYNTKRPHKALGLRTPSQAYEATVKAEPEGNGVTAHFRVRFDVVDQFGKVSIRRASKMHHLGMGIIHARTPVMILIDEEIVTVTQLKTGEVLTTHVIEESRSYWPKQDGL